MSDPWNNQYIGDIVNSINSNRAAGSRCQSQKLVVGEPLSKLVSLDVRIHGPQYSRQFDMLEAMAALPALRSIKWLMDDNYFDDSVGPCCGSMNTHRWRFAQHCSNVKKISFQDSQFRSCCLSSFLYGVKALEQFRISWGIQLAFNPTYLPKDLLKVLAQHTKQSLEVLRVTGVGQDQNSAVFLKEFQVLKDITVDIGIFKTEEGRLQKLLDVLPRSIECAILRMEMSESRDHYIDINALLTGFQSESFPKLERIIFDLSWMGLKAFGEPMDLYVMLEALGFEIIEGPADHVLRSWQGSNVEEGSFVVGIRYVGNFLYCTVTSMQPQA